MSTREKIDRDVSNWWEEIRQSKEKRSPVERPRIVTEIEHKTVFEQIPEEPAPEVIQ